MKDFLKKKEKKTFKIKKVSIQDIFFSHCKTAHIGMS